MIEPSVGRVVWYWGGIVFPHPFTSGTPLAATVAKVNQDGTLNLSVIDETGWNHSVMNVWLVQPEELQRDPLTYEMDYCTWMPWQIQQKAQAQAQPAAPWVPMPVSSQT